MLCHRIEKGSILCIVLKVEYGMQSGLRVCVCALCNFHVINPESKHFAIVCHAHFSLLHFKSLYVCFICVRKIQGASILTTTTKKIRLNTLIFYLHSFAEQFPIHSYHLSWQRVENVLIVVLHRHHYGDETVLVIICAMHADFTTK